MLDVKKLITGFLILTLGASASAFILSNTNSPQVSGALSANTSGQAATTPPLSNNAFNQSNNADVVLPSDETASSTNLTDGVADAFVNGIVAANPNGLQEDANGNPIVTTPDDQTLSDALQNEPALQNPNLTIPNWDQEVKNFEGKIKVIPYSTTTAVAYVTSVSNLVNSQLIQTGLSNMAQDENAMPANGATVITAGQSASSNMLSSALALSTPAPLVAFQKSFIKLLVYEQNLASLVQNENNSADPAMTVAVLQAKESDYQNAVQDFNTQGQALITSLNNTAYGSPQDSTSGLLSLVNTILFINKAHAQWSVFDWLNQLTSKLNTLMATQSAWARFFEKLALNMALQITKNLLMAVIQQKVLAYIQNSGAPRFVTNMGTAMVNAAEQSALNAINSNFACINTNGAFPRIQIVLNAIYKPGNNVCAAQFASQLSSANLNNFYNNFSNGGFVTFGQTLMPSNDFYGGLFFTAQNAAQAAQQSQNVLGIKTTAAQGFSNSQVCPDGSNPSGYHCERSDGSIYNVSTPSCGDTGDILTPNDDRCANGTEPAVTMPGIINQSAMDTALKGHTQLISDANDIAGIVQAAANSLIMGIVNAGVNAVTQTVNGALQGDGGIMSINPTSITAPAATSTAVSALSCSPANEIIESPGTQAAFFANGGTFDANGNQPTYIWTSSDGQTGAGMEFDVTYNAIGTYTVTLGDSQGDASTTCTATVNNNGNVTSTVPFSTSTSP
ncbi:MAG: PKD domain-containing protein [Minisyncoccia bacterium]